MHVKNRVLKASWLDFGSPGLDFGGPGPRFRRVLGRIFRDFGRLGRENAGTDFELAAKAARFQLGSSSCPFILLQPRTSTTISEGGGRR